MIFMAQLKKNTVFYEIIKKILYKRPGYDIK